MKKHERTTCGWQVVMPGMVGTDGLRKIVKLSRVYHVKSAAADFMATARLTFRECYIAEVNRPERKELGIK